MLSLKNRTKFSLDFGHSGRSVRSIVWLYYKRPKSEQIRTFGGSSRSTESPKSEQNCPNDSTTKPKRKAPNVRISDVHCICLFLITFFCLFVSVLITSVEVAAANTEEVMDTEKGIFIEDKKPRNNRMMLPHPINIDVKIAEKKE